MIEIMEEIKSPLPPRKVSFGNEEADRPVTEVRSTIEGPPAEIKTVEIKPKKLPFGVIAGVAAVIILGLIFGVIVPKIKSGGGGKEVVLNYWGLWEESAVIEGVIADFELKNPTIRVNYKKNSKEDYRTRLKARLAKTGDEEEGVDMFRFHANWLPNFKDELAVVPATVANNLQIETDFHNVYKTDLKEKGAYWAVPLMYDGLAMFYNKEILDAAQVNVPKTWWGLEGAAVRLTVKDEASGKISRAGAALGITGNVDHWSDIVGLMLRQNGINLAKDDSVNNNKLRDVLAYYTLFKTKHGVWDESLPSSTEFFANGKLAFYFGPSWRVFNFNDMNPGLKFEVVGVPQLPTTEGAPIDQLESSGENLTNIHWASYWVEGVNKKSKKQKEVWKFLEYLASKEGLERMYQTAVQVREFGEIYPRKSMADKIENVRAKAFVRVADNASSWYLASRTFDKGINDEMIKYFEDAINKITDSREEAENVVPDLRKGIEQLTQKYKLK